MRRIPISALPFVALLALAACSREPDERQAPAAQAAPAPVLADVDLTQPVRVLGTEPFWGLDITSAGLVYSGVDRPEQRADNGGPTILGTSASWSETTDGGAVLKVDLFATECSDGMSDRIYPLTARVEIGDETLAGCAAATSAILSAGESGPVVEQPVG